MPVGLDWVLPMMQFIFLHVTCSCIFHVNVSFHFFISGCDVFLSDRLHMAPKRKSTPTRNPLGFRSSSSDPPVPPLHVRFHDGEGPTGLP